MKTDTHHMINIAGRAVKVKTAARFDITADGATFTLVVHDAGRTYKNFVNGRQYIISELRTGYRFADFSRYPRDPKLVNMARDTAVRVIEKIGEKRVREAIEKVADCPPEEVETHEDTAP